MQDVLSQSSSTLAVRRLLIPGAVESVDPPAVDARSLHAHLEVGKDFSTWIKGRIEKYGFVDGFDYATYLNLDSPELGNQDYKPKHGGDRKTTEYALTLDMAKELCMVENNSRGKDARRYFLEMERLVKSVDRDGLVQQVWEIQYQLEEAVPAVDFYSRVVKSVGSMTLDETAKTLQWRYRDFYAVLRNIKILKKSSKRHVPYAPFVDKGYFKFVPDIDLDANGDDRTRLKLMVTPKGLTWLCRVLCGPSELGGKVYTLKALGVAA